MNHDTDKLILEIETTAAELGIAPSTLTARVGQGGMFYDRLVSGKRAWPETIQRVRARMLELRVARQKLASANRDGRA